MKILAFETSCDDTAVAVVDSGTQVLASIRLTQAEHNDWGGVVPEIAARLHAENWRTALDKCLAEASLSIQDIDALAVTKGPGLQTSLLSGTTAASFLSLLYQKPLIPVHHVYGHLCSVFLERAISDIKFPALVLTVSGGHTSLYYWETPTDYKCLGNTLDDAAGEAFDKTAKMLGLGYPGGPIVAQQARNGEPDKYPLPVPQLGKNSLDFSFSGVKAAVYRLVEKQKSGEITDANFVINMCASFEKTTGKIFIKKLKTALSLYPEIKSLYFVGGVSANTHLDQLFTEFCNQQGLDYLRPQSIQYSTDNAAMIGSGAYFLAQKNPELAQVQFIDPVPRLAL